MNAGPGHNTAGAQLRSFIERIERLIEEVAELKADIKEVKSEAKAFGFDGPTLNRLLKIRAMDQAKLAEQDAMLDLYMHAIGMADDVDEVWADVEKEAQAAAAAGEKITANPHMSGTPKHSVWEKCYKAAVAQGAARKGDEDAA